MRLSKTEKDEIAKLYRCMRSAEEQEIQDLLNREVDELISKENTRIEKLQHEIKELEILKTAKIEENGYSTIDRYGCMRSHPILDEFRAETNAQLMKLWSGDITTISMEK